MRNITFRAEESLIEAARNRARRERSTLNDEFRRWLEQYARGEEQSLVAMQVISDIRSRVRTGGRLFTREELNAR